MDEGAIIPTCDIPVTVAPRSGAPRDLATPGGRLPAHNERGCSESFSESFAFRPATMKSTEEVEDVPRWTHGLRVSGRP